MKLTRTAFMEKGAEVSAKRAVDFENMAREKDASDSARMFPTLMILMGGLTMNRLADNLGLTKEDNEVDVTKEITIFCIELSDALFGKENEDDSEKADS